MGWGRLPDGPNPFLFALPIRITSLTFYPCYMKSVVNLIFVLCFSVSCGKTKDVDSPITIFIDSIHVSNLDVVDLDIDNRQKLVTVTCYEDQDIADVRMSFFFPEHIRLRDSESNQLTLDLERTDSFTLLAGDKVIQFKLNVKLIPKPFRQDSFVISTFHGIPGGEAAHNRQVLENTKKANFTHFETTFTTPAGSVQALQIAEGLGLKVIVQDYSKFGGFQNYDAQIAKTTAASVAEAVALYSNYKSFAGYYVWDEPFLEQLPQVRRDLDLLRRYDPGKLFLVVTLQSYSPTYTWENGKYTRYIDELLSVVDPPLLCTNYYVYEQDIKQGISLADSKLWKDWGYIRKKANERGVPFWLYTQLMGDILDGQVGDISIEQVAVQNYIALALGAKGISYYNTIGGIFDEQGTPNHLFNDVAALNTETLSIGNKLLNASSQKTYHTGDILHDDYLDKLADSDLLESVSAGLLVGEFENNDSGESLVLLVNTDYENVVSGTVMLKGSFQVGKLNRQTGQITFQDGDLNAIAIDIPPGRGELFVLRQHR